LVVTALATEGYTFMHPDSTVVVQVRTSRNATEVEEDEEEAATEEATPAAE
jgi:large subunit ribosomal protein L25